MTTSRIALYGGPLDGHVSTFELVTARELPTTVFVYRANPRIVLACAPPGDPDVLAESFLAYRRTGQRNAEGAEIYSCMS